MRFLILAAVLSGCGGMVSRRGVVHGPTRHAAVEGLPVLARITGGPTELILRGHLDRAEAASLIRTAQQVYEDVNARFVLAPGRLQRPPVDVCIFDTTEEYVSFSVRVLGQPPAALSGVYMGRQRLVLVNLEADPASLPHEVVHPLIKDDFPDMPWWLNEGLASLYGGGWHDGERYRFRSDHRYGPLLWAVRDENVPSLRKLTRSGYDDVYGPRQDTYYSLSRYVLLYLDRLGLLDEFYRDLRGGRPTAARQMRTLSRYIDYEAFLVWAVFLR